LVAGRTVWFYLGKILWPTNLTFIYPRWRVSQAVAWQYSFPIATLLLLSTLWSLRGRTRGPLAGMLYFIGTLFPVLGFLNVYPFRYSFVADHFQYLASLGAIVLVSAGVALLLGRRQLWQRPAGYALSLSLLAVLAGLTWRQSRMYSDIETLFRTTIARNPACWMAHNHLGILLAGRGQVPEAIDHFQTALNIKPDHAEGHHNLSKALQRQGALDQAIIHARQAIALDPRNTECHFHLGNMLSQRGRMDAAIDEFREALAIKPGFLKVHINLGIVLLGRGHLDEARHHFQQALTLDPKHAGARQNLGVVLYEQGRIPEALTCWREVLRVQPDQLAVLTRCAWILATDPDPAVRNGTEAVALAERAVRLSGGRDPAILDTLAAACAEAGQFPEALHFAQLALEQARALGHTALVEALPARIQLYRAGSAYREPRILSKGPSFPARR
jgi:tetratricopeptide (TPR) repeat protein